LQWQMLALQAKQQPSASSGAADAPIEEWGWPGLRDCGLTAVPSIRD
jgi:hypothetical protein